MFINAIQGVDALVEGFAGGLAASMRRSNADAEGDALGLAESALDQAEAWRKYALSLQREVSRLAQQLSEVNRDCATLTERANNQQTLSAQYTGVLISRIEELDDLYQIASARASAHQQTLMQIAARGVKPSVDGASYQLAASEIPGRVQARFDSYMATTDVRLGVPADPAPERT